jgi:2,3-diaminopropionate biosynthesis protein SbnB
MNQKVEFTYLSQEHVLAADLGMAQIIDVIQDVFSLHENHKIILPDKIVLDLGERERGRINGLPAYVGGKYEVCGIKWIPSFPKNPVQHGLPRASALIILNNADNGLPLAVMDGTWVSAMRTGAVTGVAARFLARRDASSMAMIGCGVQAITQIMAVRTVLALRAVRLYDPRAEACARLQRQVNDSGLEVRTAGSPQEAVEGADVVVTATVADEPIVKKAWLKSGVFFAHIGSYQEEEYAVVESADKIVVDDWHQVLHRGTPVLAKMYRAGIIRDEDIYANLGEIVAGLKKGRESEQERIFFQPMGMGSEDVAVALRVYQQANQKGLGTILPLWQTPVFT